MHFLLQQALCALVCFRLASWDVWRRQRYFRI